MADKKISELLEADPLDGTEDLPIVKDGSTVRCSTQDIADLTLKHVKVSLTSAEILALNTTPKSIVAAPGAGKVIRVLSAVMRLNFVTQAYTSNVVSAIQYSGTSTNIISNSVIGASETTISEQLASTSVSYTPATSDPANKAIVLKATAGDPTTGDCTLDVYLSYWVIQL